MRLVIDNVSKLYADTVALKNCSLIFEHRTFNAIVGPNGSGKSTLLKIASLLESPDSGAVKYIDNNNEQINYQILRKKIAVVLAGNTLFNDNVYNNVAFGLRIRKLKRSFIKKRVHKILEDLQLIDKMYSHVRSLSTGEAQRVMLARALVLEPDYLFLDEPTASLDPVNTEIIESVLKEFRNKNGSTIVMITHNMFQARRLADRIIFIYRGSIVEDTGADNFFDSPQNPLVKAFISGELIW